VDETGAGELDEAADDAIALAGAALARDYDSLARIASEVQHPDLTLRLLAAMAAGAVIGADIPAAHACTSGGTAAPGLRARCTPSPLPMTERRPE